MPKQRLWIVIRAQDYRLTALADPLNPCWEEVSGDTIISEDRESMFQLARQFGGLLCSADGLPSPRQADRFRAAADAYGNALEGKPAETSPDETRRTASVPGLSGELPLAKDPANAAAGAARSAQTPD
jgi:hypothetical protein